MPSPSAQHIFAERRVSLAVALLLSCLLAMIWGEGIAIADQVNSTATTVAPDSHAEGIAPPGEPVHVDEPPSAESKGTNDAEHERV